MSKKKKKPVKLKLKATTLNEIFGPNFLKKAIADNEDIIKKSVLNKLIPAPNYGLKIPDYPKVGPGVSVGTLHPLSCSPTFESLRHPAKEFNLERVPKTADEYPAAPLGFIDDQGAGQ